MNEQRSRTEAEILGHLWAVRQTEDRFIGRIGIEALTLTGTFPDTTLEIRWTDLRVTGGGHSDVMTIKLWPQGDSTPERIDASIVAEDIIEDLHWRSRGD